MNDIHITGYLGSEPEVKTFDSGSSLTSFRVGAQTTRKDTDGNYLTNWYDAKAWGKTGEFAAKYAHKGDKVTIGGEIILSRYKDKNGVERLSPEVRVINLDLTSKAKGGENPAPAVASNPVANEMPAETGDELPF